MNLFCDFNKFLFSYEIPEALSPSAMDATYFYGTDDSEVPDLLLLFYCILANFVSEAHVAKPNYFSYAEIDETKATIMSYSQRRKSTTADNTAYTPPLPFGTLPPTVATSYMRGTSGESGHQSCEV